MPLHIETDEFEPHDNDLDAILRLQAILLQASEGARGQELDREYKTLRSALLGEPTYERLIPSLVSRHRDLGSLWPALKSFNAQWEPRRQEVRSQFESLLAEVERLELFGSFTLGDHASAAIVRASSYDPSAWTGATKPAERLIGVRTLLPVAQAAVENLITALEAPGHNGGPPLDTTEEALGALRLLHRALAALLTAADEGKLTEVYNDGLAAEAARYAKRAAKALRDDPLPYALSATVLAVMSACGLPGIGGYLAGVAIAMKRKQD